MRKLIACLLLGSPGLLGAQPFVLPPGSSLDNVIVKTAGVNGGSAYWDSPSTLGSYRVSGDGYQDPLSPGSADQHLGLVWTSSAPSSLSSARQRLNSSGGFIRAIFVGETAGWFNNFGYSYTGNPSGNQSYTAWRQIQSNGASPNISFGDYFDVPITPGAMSSFDFWFNAASNDYGGIYTLLNAASEQSLWANRSLAVNTWIPSTSSAQLVDTYMVSFEDWRLLFGADADYSDFRLALQFYNSDGTPLQNIPEPGTWAAIAGALALGYVLIRKINCA